MYKHSNALLVRRGSGVGSICSVVHSVFVSLIKLYCIVKWSVMLLAVKHSGAKTLTNDHTGLYQILITR